MPGKIESHAEQPMMGRDCRVVLERVQYVQSQLDLKQTPVYERVRAFPVESRPNSDDMVFASPDSAFRAVRLFLVGVDNVPREVQLGRHGSDFRAGLVVHAYSI